MHEDQSRFRQAIERIDALNEEDLRSVSTPNGELPDAWVYGQRMSERLERFSDEPSEELRLAVRAQHLGRWKILRDEYPTGRKGYLQWRTTLGVLHAELAAEIMAAVGYEQHAIEKTSSLIRKRNLKRDPETQTLEDVACLVFLEHYFSAFAKKHDQAKVQDIVKKTWRKMSEKAHAVALELPLSSEDRALVVAALS